MMTIMIIMMSRSIPGREKMGSFIDRSCMACRTQVTDKNQSVYIYACGAAIIDVRGKGKSVTLDACKKTQVHINHTVILPFLAPC